MHDEASGTPSADGLSRRGLLRGATAAVAAAGISGAALTGCSSTAGASGQVSDAGQVTLPTYQPLASQPAADLPGTAAGVPNAYYDYPASPVRAFSSPPLDGAKISAVSTIFGSPPPGRGSNPAWQEIESRLGGTVDLNMVVADDYDTKLSTVIASGDLPDIMLYDGAGLTNLPEFLASQCADLGPLLGGAKAKDYPHLAAIPQVFWEQCTAAGKLYFLPIPRNVSAGSGFYHQEMLAAAGVTSTQQIRDSADFLSLLKDLTSPGKGRYAVAGATTNGGFSEVIFHLVFGTPNQWRVDAAGKLTSSYETDEYKAAVEFMAKVHKAGCYYPGSQGWTKTKMEDAFQSGKAAFIYDGLPGFGAAWTAMKKIDPAFKPMPIIPFGHDGGAGVTWADNVLYAKTMIKKSSTDHLREVLKACDFFASPFGTEEYLLLNYGVEGKDYTLNAGHNPILTAKGTNDTQVPWKYLGAPQSVVYSPGDKALTDVTHQAYAEIVPKALPNPCANLYSPTFSSKGSTLTQAMTDAVARIVTGQSSPSALDTAVRTWRSNGGDTMRSEYEKAYAHARAGK